MCFEKRVLAQSLRCCPFAKTTETPFLPCCKSVNCLANSMAGLSKGPSKDFFFSKAACFDFCYFLCIS